MLNSLLWILYNANNYKYRFDELVNTANNIDKYIYVDTRGELFVDGANLLHGMPNKL